MSLKVLIEAIEQLEGNIWALSFVCLYGIGYMLKEHTSLNNKLIPWVLLVVGMAIGYMVLMPTVGGLMVGAVMSFTIMWFYDSVKELISEYFLS